MARPVPSRVEGCDASLPGPCAREARQVQEPSQSLPTEGPRARSRSPGGGVGQQHGHRRTTGSSPKYREPTPPPPVRDPEQAMGGTFQTLQRRKAQWPRISPALGGSESWGPWGLSGGDMGTRASARTGRSHPSKLYSHHAILGTSCLPSVSLGWTGGRGLRPAAREGAVT